MAPAQSPLRCAAPGTSQPSTRCTATARREGGGPGDGGGGGVPTLDRPRQAGRGRTAHGPMHAPAGLALSLLRHSRPHLCQDDLRLQCLQRLSVHRVQAGARRQRLAHLAIYIRRVRPPGPVGCGVEGRAAGGQGISGRAACGGGERRSAQRQPSAALTWRRSASAGSPGQLGSRTRASARPAREPHRPWRTLRPPAAPPP